MKFTIDVRQTSNGYYGYAINGDQILFESKVCSSAAEASGEVVKFIQTKNNPYVTSKKQETIQEIDRSHVLANNSPINPNRSRCCGRG